MVDRACRNIGIAAAILRVRHRSHSSRVLPAETRVPLQSIADSGCISRRSFPSPPSGQLLSTYGAFAANELADYPLAERMMRDAIDTGPTSVALSINLAKVLLLTEQDQRGEAVDQRDRVTQLEKVRCGGTEETERRIAAATPFRCTSGTGKLRPVRPVTRTCHPSWRPYTHCPQSDPSRSPLPIATQHAALMHAALAAGVGVVR